MEGTLNKISNVINWYEGANIKHLEELNKALKVITSNMYLLELERAKYHEKHQDIMYELTNNQDKPVSKAEIVANKNVPELYLLRRVMNAAYRCSDSIRTNISYMKKELSNT